jgi:hypothetical protein
MVRQPVGSAFGPLVSFRSFEAIGTGKQFNLIKRCVALKDEGLYDSIDYDTI